jgi:hypothetical protein
MPRQMLYLDRRQLFQNDADRVLPQFISEPLRCSQHQAVPIFDGKVDGFQGMLMPLTYFPFQPPSWWNEWPLESARIIAGQHHRSGAASFAVPLAHRALKY